MKTTTNTYTAQNKSTNVLTTAKLLILAALSTIALTSCESNEELEPITPDTQVDSTTEIFGGVELDNSIQDAREEALQTFTLDIATGGTIIGEQGTQLYFPANGLEYLGGEPVTGDVNIQLIEIYSKADMIAQQLPTNGKLPNGDVQTIVSGGEFFIKAYKGGEELVTNQPFQLTATTDSYDDAMTVFRPENCETMDCDVVWEEDEEDVVINGEIQNPDGTWSSAYLAPLTSFGWTNLDKWWSYDGAKTMVYADVPEGFNETNSSVYVSYDGEPGALALFDSYDTDLDMFTEHYGQMPVGLEVHFIFVSVQDGDYIYAIQGATIGVDHVETFTTTQTTTEAGLTALINALP